MKKLLALVISVCMLFTLSTNVMAYSDVEEGTYVSEAVTVLSDLGILDGYTDGSFKPDATVTRAEMAKIICATLDYDHMGANKTPFIDVEPKHWAAGYVNSAYNLGIINGYGDGKFGPEDIVTYEQAVKMFVSALGYEPMAIEKGGWPNGYMAVATNIGLVDGVKGSTRGDIAVLAYNALTTPIMEQTSYGSETRYEILDGKGNKEYKTILTNQDIYVVTGKVTEKVDVEKVNFEFTRDSEDKNYKEGKSEYIYINDTNIDDYIYQEIDVYVSKINNKLYVLAFKAANVSDTFTIISDDIKSVAGSKVTYYIDSLNSSKTKTFSIEEDIVVEYNKNTDVKTLEDLIDMEDIQLVFIENSGNNKYDVVVATEYTSTVIDTVDAYKEKMILNDGTSITFDLEDEDKTYVFVDDEGKYLDLSDFEDEDVIAYTHNGIKNIKDADYIKIIKLTNSVVYGTVESVYTNDSIVTIDGEDYKVTDDYVWYEIADPGVEGKFYIGLTGKIIYFDGSAASGKYGYIFDYDIENGFDDDIIIKMLTEKGVDVYTLKDSVEFDEDMINTLVEFKINSKGLISNIKPLNTTKIAENKNIYNANTEMLNGKYVDEDTQIFVIDSKDDDDSYVTDIDYLVDEGSYEGVMYLDYNEVKVIVITDSNMLYTNETGFAIVTNTRTVSKDEETVFAVSYVQDETKGTIYFEDMDYEDGQDIFAIGTVFVFNADSKGYVKNNDYDIVASIGKDLDFVYDEDVYAKDRYGKDVEVAFGYIENDRRDTNSKGELITIDEDQTYVITSKTNRYTYDEEYKNKIEISDFLSGNAYYGNNTAVMLKIVDGVVVDIYTISPEDID